MKYEFLNPNEIHTSCFPIILRIQTKKIIIAHVRVALKEHTDLAVIVGCKYLKKG